MVLFLVFPLFSENEIKLHPPDGANSDFFGSSVTIYDNWLAIGVPLDDDNGPESGSVYIFQRLNNNWIFNTKIIASDGSADDRFSPVALVENYLFVGAAGHYVDGRRTWAVYVFNYSGNIWNEQQKLIPNDSLDYLLFGLSIGANRDFIIIGAPGDNQNGVNSGSAYIFKNINENWILDDKLLPHDGDANDRFGNSVSIFNDHALVGAPEDSNENGAYAGSAYIFKRDANRSGWIEQGKLIASNGSVNDIFGISVAIYNDYVAIGQPGNILATGPGSVHIPKWDTIGAGWNEYQKLSASDGLNKNYFGLSVSLDDDSLLIGAYGDTVNGSYSGSAYIFKLENDGWIEQIKLTASDGNAGDWFGYRTSLHNSVALVGAPVAEHNGIESGAAYLYHNMITGVKEETPKIPLQFELVQNYPNLLTLLPLLAIRFLREDW